MSLEDEIDKLRSAERVRLELQDATRNEFAERQKARFLPLRAVLEQVLKAIDPAYLQVSLGDARATITVGTHRDDSFQGDIDWKISPNSRFNAEAGKEWFEVQPGFSIEEVESFHLPGLNLSERTYTFETEGEVAQHIRKKMAEKIAHYQHLKASTDQRTSNDPAS
jgi:hypothetical protein